MKIFSGLMSVLIAVLALAFALANRQTATISIWPLGIDLEAPLCLLTLGPLFMGVLLGATITWFNMIPHRRRTRQLTKDLTKLQNKVSGVQATLIAPPKNRSERDDGRFLLGAPKPKRRFWTAKP